MKLLISFLLFALFFGVAFSKKNKKHNQVGNKNGTADFIFSATSPKIIQPFSKYPIILTLFSAKDPVDFKFSISTTPHEGTNKTAKTLLNAEAKFKPGDTAIVELNVDMALVEEVYNISIKGKSESGHESSDHGLVYLERKSFSIIVQTDKPLYKPGDKISFRVLFLDRLLKPVPVDLEEKKVSIEVLDSEGNIVKSWKGAEIPFRQKYGFVKALLPLSKEPNLGSWSIQVSQPNVETHSHSFAVEQYVLPKFKVDLKLNPTFATFNQSAFSVTVNFKYTHEKGVKGKCSVTLKRGWAPLYYFDANGEQIRDKRPKSVTKTKTSQGQEVFNFDLKEDLKIRDEEATEWGVKYKVDASCTEDATGKMQNATGEISLYRYPWKIELANPPDSYKPGFPLNLWIKVSRRDDVPVSDSNPEALKIRHGFAYHAEEGLLFKKIPKTGLVHVTFDPPTNDLISITGIEATYKGMTQMLFAPTRQISDTNSYMTLTLLNEREDMSENTLKSGQKAKILVKVNKPFEALMWVIMARGVPVKWKKVPTQGPKQEFNLTIPIDSASFEPHFYLLVYSVLPQANDIVADFIKIGVKGGEDRSKMTIEVDGFVGKKFANKTIEPGTNVTITWNNVAKDALFAIRAVDQSVLIMREEKAIDRGTIHDIEKQFEDGMSSYRSWGGSESFRIFENLGLLILTNAVLTKDTQAAPIAAEFRGSSDMVYAKRLRHPIMASMASAPIAESMDDGENSGSNSNDGGDSSGQPRLRSSFPETWIFTEVTEGESMNQTVPDTITSWVINGFQISPSKGLGILKEPTKLTVFRPFFISLNLPYSVVKHEIFSLQVLVHNYLGKEVGATVTLDNSERGWRVSQGETGALTKKIELKDPQGVEVVNFLIIPKHTGTHVLTIKAVVDGHEAGDTISQPLLVKPNGVRQSKSDAVFFNFVEKKEPETQTLKAILPPTRVEGGDTLKVSLIGDILGGVADNLDNLIQLPSGCGEQNMAKFIPNVVVLNYLKAVDALSMETRAKAISFLETGYQRQLKFKRFDGSFSAFGNSDPDGSTWLTAFVVRSFMEAKRYISIDNSVITQALEWLIKQQDDNGSFAETGYVHDSILQHGGEKTTRSLSAYVLLAFYEAKGIQGEEKSLDYDEVFDKGMKWLVDIQPEQLDTYSVLITSYLLHLLNHPKKEDYFKEMKNRVTTEEKTGLMSWEVHPVKVARGKLDVIDQEFPSLKPAVIEKTAYGLLTYVIRERGKLKDSLKIGKWLMKHRNGMGGFLSTQDTVVGIQALSTLAEATNTPDYLMDVRINYTGGLHAFTIKKRQRSVIQEYFLPDGVDTVDIEAQGMGSVIVQLDWSYYTMSTGNSGEFLLEVQVTPKDNNRLLDFKICTAHAIPGNTNMVILEVNTPTGYAFDAEELYSLRKHPEVKKDELEESDSRLNIYFNALTENQTCVNIRAHRFHFVAKHAKSSVTVYDYYDTTKKVTKFYDAPEISICQICTVDNSCKEHKCYNK